MKNPSLLEIFYHILITNAIKLSLKKHKKVDLGK